MKYMFLLLICFLLLFSSCKKAVEGCTDLTAFNYDAEANTDNGSCSKFFIKYKLPNEADSMNSDATHYLNSIVSCSKTISFNSQEDLVISVNVLPNSTNLILCIDNFTFGSNKVSYFDISGSNIATFNLTYSHITGWDDSTYTGFVKYNTEGNSISGSFNFMARSELLTNDGGFSEIGVKGEFENLTIP